MKRTAFLMLAFAALVAGCGSDSASYMVNGDRDTAFSLFRSKDFPGQDWKIDMALTHMPECQRRYPLKRASGDASKISLYRNAEGGYALQAGDAWYQGRLEGCRLQESASAPAAPGELIGAWEDRADGFKFYPVQK